MTLSQYFHLQRLVEMYEERESKAHFHAAMNFILCGVVVLITLFTGPWMLILATVFAGAGIGWMIDAMSAREMVEELKWRMI